MLKRLLPLLFAIVVVFPLASAMFAQEAPAKAKEARWEGTVIRSSAEKSTLTVRKVGTANEEITVYYDSSTKWVSQYHGDTKVNNIEPSDVKDGDRVICTGALEKAGVLHATLISKRLSHSPN
jgi:cytochrome c-type biogenesis protein CcmE